jgi:hypothetical protein
MKKALILILMLILVGCTNSKEEFVIPIPEPPQTFEFTNNIVKWDKVKYAIYYHITINEITYKTLNNYLDVSNLADGNYQCVILAENKDGIMGAASVAFYFKKQSIFPIPSNLIIQDEILSWENLQDALKYKVMINDSEYEVVTNQYDLTNLPLNNTYNIKVKAVYEYQASVYSDVLIYHNYSDIHDTFQLTFNKNTITDLEINFSDLNLNEIKFLNINDEYVVQDNIVTLKNTYLQTLDYGNNTLNAYTNKGIVLLEVTIIDDREPYLLSSSSIIYNGDDIIIEFEVYNALLQDLSGNSITTNDFQKTKNAITINHQYIDMKFKEEGRETLILSYTISSELLEISGWIFIKKK